MSIAITLQQALREWENRYSASEALWPHLSDDELDLSALKDSEKRGNVVDHLCRCRFCAERYRDQQEELELLPAVNSWDVAVLKAAAGEEQTFPVLYYSEKKYYRIEIMRNTAGGEDGLAVLTIIDPRMAVRHEGLDLWICDARGKKLLRGRVKNGEVWQKVARLQEYDYSELLVYLADQDEPTHLTF